MEKTVGESILTRGPRGKIPFRYVLKSGDGSELSDVRSFGARLKKAIAELCVTHMSAPHGWRHSRVASRVYRTQSDGVW